jgi:hypothetical protein
VRHDSRAERVRQLPLERPEGVLQRALRHERGIGR